MIVVDRGPFEMVPHWLLHSDVTAQAIRLYLLLRKHGDGEGMAFPGRKRLAEQLKASKSTVDRAKAELVAVGALCETQRVSDAGDWTSNEYHVHWDANLVCERFSTGDKGCPVYDDTLTASDDTGCPASDELTYTHINNLYTLTHTKNDHFDEFWFVYPRKAAKQAAKKIWTRVIKSVDPSVIIQGAIRYADDPNRSAEFTAHASTWLNAGRWEDDDLPTTGSGSGTRAYVEAAHILSSNPYLELEPSHDSR